MTLFFLGPDSRVQSAEKEGRAFSDGLNSGDRYPNHTSPCSMTWLPIFRPILQIGLTECDAYGIASFLGAGWACCPLKALSVTVKFILPFSIPRMNSNPFSGFVASCFHVLSCFFAVGDLKSNPYKHQVSSRVPLLC